jgi:pimeloyl-ACP methyl ester carboxylesterase
VTTLPLPGERSIVVETWGDGPPVYLMHGWGGWRGQLGAFVDPLVAAGHRVVAIDAPSHGDAAPGAHGPGKADPGELLEALRAVVAVHGRPAGVVAHSLGCTVTAMAALDGLSADRFALIAPAVEPTSQFDAFTRLVGAGRRTRARAVTVAERIARRPFADFDVARRLPGAAVPPALVVHDVADKEVPYDVGARLAEVWPDAELLTTDGLGHQRILRDPAVVAAVVDYVTRRTPRAGALAGAEEHTRTT